jgi:signal transduction histidine kinase
MLKPPAIGVEEHRFVLSSLSPGPAQKRVALAVVLGLLVIFALITFGPLRGTHLRRVDAFVPAYVTAMLVNDSITAILLYAQFSIVRSAATLVIASGYLFTGLLLIPFVLVFPDVFVPGNLVGGLQSTSWLWMFQHAGFPIFVVAYALSKDARRGKPLWQGTIRAAIALSATLTAAIVAALASLCIAGDALLPRVALDSLHFSALWPYFIGGPVALLSISAAIVLRLRQRSVLDLWLLVVMCLFLIEVPLSYYPDPSRFSVGWYTVRVIGFLSSSLVLIVLLYEITALYAGLLGAVIGQRREREARLMTGDAVAATVAHEVRQPLTAMVTSADAGFRFLDRAVPNLDRAKEAFRRIVADGHRAGAVVESIRANFRNDARDRAWLDVNDLVQEAIALERGDLQKYRIVIQVEPNGRLPKVRGNRVQLQQVLLNLIANAIDAMAINEHPRILHVKFETYEDECVMLSVADTGAGISAENIDRIFNPLFTTKEDGMGMGLAICRSIIESHDGQLWFAPNTPHGAVFQFTLRADDATSLAANSRRGAGAITFENTAAPHVRVT